MVKILAFSDFHDKRSFYRRASRLINEKKPDFVIISGDMSNYGSKNKIEKLLSTFGRQTYYVWGNMDGKDPRDRLEKAINLHLNPVEINNMILVGLGGDDKAFEKNFHDFYKVVENFSLQSDKKLVLVSHVPPYKHGDLTKEYLGQPGKNVGSKNYLNLIKKYHPALVICGHIHEARGTYKINKTLIINVGKEGYELIIDSEIIVNDLINEDP
ncbi:MAG: metallophosphoesterase family protein [Candidatus Helarchaeota archaeon]